MAVELADAYVSLVPSAKGISSKIGAELNGPLTKAGKTAGIGASAAFATAMKVGLAGAVAGIGAVVAGGFAAFKIGESFDKEFDKIRVGTGATGEVLGGLEGSFKNVLKTVPTSFDDAGTAIADLNTRLGLTGEPLEALSGQFINLSRITKTDVGQNIDDITRVFGDWGVATGDQSKALDNIYRASQASGIGINDLSTSVVQFGAPLRNLGFGFDESLGLLAQFNKTGVNTETVFAGLKAGVGKLAKEGEPVPDTFRRVVDEITALGPGSEATGLAIELFGQRAGPDLADAIAGGKFEIDGMLSAITDGSDTINGAADDTASFSEKWSVFKNRILVGLQPLATKVFDGVGRAMDVLGPKVEPVIAWFSEKLPVAIGAVKKFVEKNWPKVRKVLAQVFDWIVDKAWPPVKDVFDEIVDAAKDVADWFSDNWPKIRETIGKVFDWIVDHKDEVIGALVGIGVVVVATLVPSFIAWAAAATAAAAATIVAAAPFVAIGAAVAALAAGLVWAYQNVDWFRSAVDAVARFFTDTVIPAVVGFATAVKEVVLEVVETVRENWDKIEKIITTVFDSVKTYVETIWKAIEGVVRGYIEAVKGIIKTVTSLIKGDWEGVWNGIKQFLKGVWDAIKSYLGGVLGVLVQWFRDFPGRILSALGNLAPLLLQKGRDLIGGLRGGINAFWTSILRPWLNSLPGLILRAIGDLLRTLWSAGMNLLTGLKNGVLIVWSSVWTWFTGLPGQIVSAIGDLSRILYSIGRSIIGGLWDGMKDVWGDAAGWLGGLGSKIIGLKGPPARDKVLLVNNGELIMQGLRRGLESEWGNVESFLTSVTPSIAANVDVSASASRYTTPGVGASGGGQTNNFYGVQDPDDAIRRLDQRAWMAAAR